MGNDGCPHAVDTCCDNNISFEDGRFSAFDPAARSHQSIWIGRPRGLFGKIEKVFPPGGATRSRKFLLYMLREGWKCKGELSPPWKTEIGHWVRHVGLVDKVVTC